KIRHDFFRRRKHNPFRRSNLYVLAEIADDPRAINSWIDSAQENAPRLDYLLIRADFLASDDLRFSIRKTRHAVEFKLFFWRLCRFNALSAIPAELSQRCCGPAFFRPFRVLECLTQGGVAALCALG